MRQQTWESSSFNFSFWAWRASLVIASCPSNFHTVGVMSTCTNSPQMVSEYVKGSARRCDPTSTFWFCYKSKTLTWVSFIMWFEGSRWLHSEQPKDHLAFKAFHLLRVLMQYLRFSGGGASCLSCISISWLKVKAMDILGRAWFFTKWTRGILYTRKILHPLLQAVRIQSKSITNYPYSSIIYFPIDYSNQILGLFFTESGSFQNIM